MIKLLFLTLHLSNIEIAVVIVTSLGFFIMFGISSFKGGSNDLIKTTLYNDKLIRNKRK